jgi:LAO/AO transport system kinase
LVIDRNRLSSHGQEDESVWHPPILQTIALDGTGVGEVLQAVVAHREHLYTSGRWISRERARVETEMLNVLRQELLEQVLARLGEDQKQAWVERIATREVDVYTAVRTILDV